MQSKISVALLAAGLAVAADSKTQGHGVGALGTEMGPVAFLWPADRPWSADADNTAPCGSVHGVTNRTPFPLTAGAVSLSVATQAYDVDFSLSFSNDPKSNSDFTQQAVSHTIGRVEAGHQCYRLAAVPSTVKAGDNATIQLEYRSKFKTENDGRDQTFYACADIQFVDTTAFKSNIPCFNVTSEEFVPPQGSSPNPSTTENASAGGLSTGAIAGIAVGTIVGSLAVVGLVAFLVFKKRRGSNNAPANVEAGMKVNPEVASVNSISRR
ncbi:hypothetical protein GGTG_05662 [Gaeumannomyces tritici R3-111a-1]|uniref:Copper acquisition factor BIM1-like domain-containing protein n=1 Tax=Gaeumannomyces tritici (strain R3-111a-1) TaxID=644352 RepID=J3NWJ9_GAET3|nr:hypothetical protein GGTG_05662 [Gaeumannomyces tritici R3-111a-1]EJT75731.1 hypothetical protein GGTG_05662 [Gaeumannomyces tritici R3-111a-1]